ncbi:MAG: ribosome biogenesis GTP-binding protein YihA/YsxC [Gemmatimonadales bacterium]
MKQAGKRGGGAAGTEPLERKQLDEGHKGAQGALFSRPDSAPSPLASQPVEFVGSFPEAGVRLEPSLPEIAFIGRSNVGKSSLINALLGRPGMARVSGSPGKTTLLNFYRLPSLYLVDLPGYGFARASKTDRAGYRKLIHSYLRSRQTLSGIVWLLDIRHDPSKEDREMQDLLIESGRPVLAVLTKSDKLSRSAAAARQRELAEILQLRKEQVEMTSSRSAVGIAELAQSVLAAAQGENT